MTYAVGRVEKQTRTIARDADNVVCSFERWPRGTPP